MSRSEDFRLWRKAELAVAVSAHEFQLPRLGNYGQRVARAIQRKHVSPIRLELEQVHPRYEAPNNEGAVMEQKDETVSLISAGKVQGTNVYNTQGKSLGEVYDVMIDKMTGKIAYAVMSFGGFLGIGNRFHPLPWNSLKYDTRQGGYVVGLTKSQLEGAPTYASSETPAWGDRAYEQEIHDYYKVRPYWGI